MTYSPVPILHAAGVKLISTGKDRYRCACPVHRGSHPSMAVTLHRGRWQLTCFACGFNGGTVDLVVALRSCTVGEAFKILEGQPVEEHAPVEMYPEEVLAIACDAPGCGETIDVRCATYKTPGKQGYLWTSTLTDEAVYATSRGWEMSAQAEFALCAECAS